MANRHQTTGTRSITGYFIQQPSPATSSTETSAPRTKHTNDSCAEVLDDTQRFGSVSSSRNSSTGGVREELVPKPSERTASGTRSSSLTTTTSTISDPATIAATGTPGVTAGSKGRTIEGSGTAAGTTGTAAVPIGGTASG